MLLTNQQTLLLASVILAAQATALQIPLGSFQQPDSRSPVAEPYRPLPWGDVNILATTDTHGWLLGHQRHESDYSGDWGDLYSFVTRMKEDAHRRGVDLLLVDSGDRVDGNGLVDAEPAPNVKGWTAMSYFSQMPYDVITTGNHELYKWPTANATYARLVSHYGERYVTSNVNITLMNSVTGQQETRPLGSRYRKFRTEMGRNVTAFGPLFDFKAHAPGIEVQAPHKMVKEQWFQDAIAEEPTFFLLVGHMSIRKEPDSEWTSVVKAIRRVHPLTPIAIFGGHHHIRDCVQEDPGSMSLAAGRYMETVGFMSITGVDEREPSKYHPVFQRRYLDQNRNTYAYHAGKDFDTRLGKAITANLTRTAKSFNLTHQYGTAPQSYYLYRYPHTSSQSILNLMTEKVLPLLVTRPDRPHPSVTILNTGSIRFDIFKGPFTRNDQWIVLPFTNNFLYIPGVPRSLARQLLPYLNVVGEHHLQQTSRTSLAAEDARLETIYRQSLVASHAAFEAAKCSKDPAHLTPGYVTLDLCDDLGDDTLHRPVPATWQPIFVSTAFPEPRWRPAGNEEGRAEGEGDRGESEEEETLDVVFFDFIQPDILSALNTLQDAHSYSPGDVKLYIDSLSANTLMQEYALLKWN